MTPQTDRARYQPSGNIDAVPFAVLTAFAVGAATLAGYLIHANNPLTFPGVVIAPLVVSLPLAGAVAIVVRGGRCRNPVLGAVLGGAVGTVAFVGAFQFRLAAAKGNDHLHRLDLLPEFVRDHVHDDAAWGPQWKNKNAPPPVRAAPREIAFRWGGLALGWIVGAFGPALVGYLTSRTPFSEAHHRWLTAWNARLAHESGAALVGVLEAGRAGDISAAVVPLPAGTPVAAPGLTELTLEYLPDEPDSPVYLSISMVTVGPGKKPVVWPCQVARRWELRPDEVAALGAALSVPGAAFGPAGLREGDRAAGTLAARVDPLPDEDAGLVMSRGHVWVASLLGFSPLILGLGLGTAAGVVAADRAAGLLPAERALVIAGGVAAVVAALAWVVVYADYLPNLYYHARARRVIGRRPDPVARPDDPDALFVQVVPRKNWGKVMLENADDVGFLVLDEARGLILYEGDRERWAIPRESVLSCEVDGFDVGPSDPNNVPMFSVVVLKANVGGRVWEAPVAPRPVALEKMTPSGRRRRAEWLRDRVRRVLEPNNRLDR